MKRPCVGRRAGLLAAANGEAERQGDQSMLLGCNVRDEYDGGQVIF